MDELVKFALNSSATLHTFFNEDELDDRGIKLQWKPRDKDGNPVFLQKREPRILREIEYIEIEGPCEFRLSEFGLQRGNLGGIPVAWGITEVFGNDAYLAATRDSAGNLRLRAKESIRAGER
jgi:hypothetical protein